MSPVRLKFALAGVLLLVLATAAGIWIVQDWRYGKQLAEQAGLHLSDLSTISNAATTAQRSEQEKRLTLEQRLSVLLGTADSASGCSVPAGTGAGGVVHGGARAQLDPAHAQRIIGITDAGDDGLVALQACQAYVQEILR